jgi:hypothetical protein
MIDSPDECIRLARTYAKANAGGLLPGVVHNLQNTVHATIMQLDLWKQHLELAPKPEQGVLQKTLSRLQAATQDQIRFCQDLEQRALFLREAETPVEVHLFCDWLRRFWINDLFFKHHIALDLEVAPEAPATLNLPPLLLTLCLEEPLKNAIEECLLRDRQGQFAFSLQVHPCGSGALFSLHAETALPQDLDPWQEGATTKAGHLGLGLSLVGFVCSLVGWSCSLEEQGGQSVYSLKLPEARTRPPESLEQSSADSQQLNRGLV